MSWMEGKHLPAPAESTAAWTAFLDHVARQPALWLVSSGSNDTSPLPVHVKRCNATDEAPRHWSKSPQA